ncbi:MAG: glycogen/starch synthase, partial [Flavobacteriales bacterium]
MATKKRILYISQEVKPYNTSSSLSETTRYLPQAMNESGFEVRSFMPRFGIINERRHQLHEVIRLSGINLIINNLDQPLIIKVASIPQARLQVYFIDNEDYFKRKFTTEDAKGKAFEDNDERMIFFCRGVLETVKKLGWAPDVIHCSGWMSALLPLYLKRYHKDDPLYQNTKVVYADYNNAFEGTLNTDLVQKL